MKYRQYTRKYHQIDVYIYQCGITTWKNATDSEEENTTVPPTGEVRQQTRTEEDREEDYGIGMEGVKENV